MKFTDAFQVVAYYDAINDVYRENATVFWPKGFPPPDVPKCGFDGSRCAKPRERNFKENLIDQYRVDQYGSYFC